MIYTKSTAFCDIREKEWRCVLDLGNRNTTVFVFIWLCTRKELQYVFGLVLRLLTLDE